MAAASRQFRVIGMDCAKDAAAVEAATRNLPGVQAVRVSAASHTMQLRLATTVVDTVAIERAAAQLGYRLEPLDGGAGNTLAPSAHNTPAYRRALGIVVVLNIGFGLIEVTGGFLSDSQALKADALDFLGDGLITWLALLAIAWSLTWRARAALIQGVFLAALGLGVLANTAYRILEQQLPGAELMGGLGFLALLVNVIAAAVLVPHRAGDAHMRAVWLFSRNDAIGNAAVIAAAGLVAWTRSPWPDLAVALAIASLFLHSAWSIIRAARRDLSEESQAR